MMAPIAPGTPKAGLVKNALANYGGTVFAFLYGVLLTPFIIRTLGDTLYGTWTVIASITGYLTLFDLGLGSALSKYAAEYENRGEAHIVDQLTSTLLFAFLAIGLASLALTAWLAPWFSNFFNVPTEYRGAAIAALILLGLNFVLYLAYDVFNAVAVGFRRFDIVNLARSLALIISALLTVGALLLGGQLVALAVVACAATAMQLGLIGYLFRRWVRPVAVRWRYVHRPLLKLMLSYSAFIFVMMACNRIEQSTRPLLVGRLISIEAVTYYAVGEKLSSLVRQASFPVAGVLFPFFAALSAHNVPAEYGKLLVTGMRYATLIGLPVSAIAAILAGPLIAAWIGPAYVSSSTVAVILIGQAFVAQQLVAASSLLNGIGRLGLYTGLHVFALAFSVGFALWLAPAWGIPAVAAGSLIAWSIVLAVTLVYTSRLSALRPGQLLRTAWLRPGLVTALVGGGLLLAARRWPPQGLWQVGLQGGAAFLAYALLAWRWCLPPDEQRRISRTLTRGRWPRRSAADAPDTRGGS